MRTRPLGTITRHTGRGVRAGSALAVGALAFGSALAAAALGAQTPEAAPALPRVAVSGHLGAAYPVGALRDVATSGVRTAASVTVRVAPQVGLYAGYASAGFLARSDESDLADRGPFGGVAVALPAALRGARPVARVGAVYSRLRGESPTRPGDANRSRTLGVEAQLGWPVRVGRRAALVPALRGQSTRPAGTGRRTQLGAEVALQVGLGGR
jgi:hypothetical protein